MEASHRHDLARSGPVIAATGLSSIVDRICRGPMPRLLVIGDVILDRYTWCDAERVSPEAPVLVLRSNDQETRLGGAASVAHLLAGLGVDVALVGAVGDDFNGRAVERLVIAARLADRFLLNDAGRPTTCKERFMGRADRRHAHQVLRVDYESRAPLGLAEEKQLMEAVLGRIPSVQAVLVADYGKGVCTTRLLTETLAECQRLSVPAIVDPARNRNCENYRGAYAVKPNRCEAEAISGQGIANASDALRAAAKIRDRYGIPNVLVTLDSEGIAMVTDRQQEHFRTRERRVYDVTGAGDMALATIGLCIARGEDLASSSMLANVTAGLQVERWGVVPVTWDEIRHELRATPNRKLISETSLAQCLDEHRRCGRAIALTNGCFDLLHAGHVQCLEKAARLADILVVAINSDSSVRRLKGSSRPIVPQEHRAAVLAALEYVDYVVIFDDDTPERLLELLRPDVLVKGATYSLEEVVGKETVESHGGRVELVGELDGFSTTRLVRLIACANREPPSDIPRENRGDAVAIQNKLPRSI